ncbi:hypothetical protein DXV24_21490 [Escherichia albertii]|nr:hypothetical protein [Escherichia albertii]
MKAMRDIIDENQTPKTGQDMFCSTAIFDGFATKPLVRAQPRHPRQKRHDITMVEHRKRAR